MIKQLGLKPRRTLRVVLWTAEEIGLFGSKQYYEDHKVIYFNPLPTNYHNRSLLYHWCIYFGSLCCKHCVSVQNAVLNAARSEFIMFIMFAPIIVSVIALDLQSKNLAELSINIRHHA